MATRAPKMGLTPLRRKRCIEAMETSGRYDEAAKAAGVKMRTLFDWRQAHPDFDAELTACCERKAHRMHRKVIDAMERHLDAVLAGKRHPDKHAVHQKTGRRVLVQRGEEIALSPDVMHKVLTKVDPSWTKDTTEITLSQFEEAMDAVQREEAE